MCPISPSVEYAPIVGTQLSCETAASLAQVKHTFTTLMAAAAAA